MRIILLGPPGSGKGTQGDLIEKQYGFPKISAGDLLREAVREETPLGKKVEAYMNRGELVSDELVVGMIRERISAEDCQEGYILDGFPRNIYQVTRLEEIDPLHKEVVLDIQLNEQALIDRLSARRICSACRMIYNLQVKAPKQEDVCDACGAELVQRRDDTPEVIRRRLEVYHSQTEKLVAYYRQKHVYHAIDGDGKIEDVFTQTASVLDRELRELKEKEAVQ
jgi:adenylate kinase